MRSVGKQARDESGKYPVNEDDEEIFAHLRAKLAASPASSNSRYCAEAFSRYCEPTGRANARPMTGSAKQSSRGITDGWIASLRSQ
jgi:hypothetical protein